MHRNTKLFSLFTLLLVFAFLSSARHVNAINEQSIKVLDDQDFYAFGPSEKELDQALADNYPEWANYEQNVQWDTRPVKLGEIVSAASFDDRYNLNPAVVLVILGEGLDWEIPSNTDLFIQSQTISERLADLAFEWMKPGNEHIRTQHPEVSNGATYALYVFFDYDKEKLQDWCDTYQNLFGISPFQR